VPVLQLLCHTAGRAFPGGALWRVLSRVHEESSTLVWRDTTLRPIRIHNIDMTYHIRDARVEDAPALADTVIEPIVTTFRGHVPDQCLSWITRDESIANWQKWFWQDRDAGEFLLVAELMEGGVVGCALGGPQTADAQFDGELYVLGVLSTYQRQGIGRNLVGAVAARLFQQGIQS